MAIDNSEVLVTFKGDASSVEKAEKEVNKSFDNIKVYGEAATVALATAFDAMAISIAKSGIAYNAQIETYLTRLETLTGSAEEANEILEQIKKDALSTPFEVSSLTQAESLLLSTGLTADEARADILALGDAVSASGGGNEELQRMAVNLQQIKNVGKASALDIKQFAYAGIDIYGLLADSLEITREEASKTTVTYDMLSKALQKASQKGGKYYGAMTKQSKTYNGAMSNLNESIDVFKGAITEGLFEALKGLIPLLTDMFNWLAKNKDIVVAIAIPTLTFINILAGFVIVKTIIGLFSKLWLVLTANPIGAIVAAIAALVAAFIYLWNNCEDFRNFFINLWESLKKIVEPAVKVIVGLVKGIWDGFTFLATKLTEFLTTTVPQFIQGVVNFFAKLPSGIWNHLTKVVSNIGKWAVDMITKIGKEIPKVIKSIVDFFKELPGKLFNIGVELVKGLWDGIKSMKDWLGKKIGSFSNWIAGSFRKNLGIHSPSVLMKKEVGINIGLGVIEGIEATQRQLDNTIEDITKGISASIDFGNMGLDQSNLTSSLNYNNQPIINVYNNMELDPLGQVVSNIKTFSGGAKNDYNYGVGV